MSGFGEFARKFGPTLAATAAANGALVGFVGHGEVPEVRWTSSYEYVTDRVTSATDWHPVGYVERSSIIPGSESTTDLSPEETPAGGSGAPGEDTTWDGTVNR